MDLGLPARSPQREEFSWQGIALGIVTGSPFRRRGKGEPMLGSRPSGHEQKKTQCRKCAVRILVTLEAGETPAPGLAVFYCPDCGDRNQVEVPAGYDPLSVSATPDSG